MKVAIASGKGGTGKTTLATNLAVFLARAGPVILVDLDVEEPNSGLFIQGEFVHEEPALRMVPEWVGETCIHCGKCMEVCNFNAVLRFSDSTLVLPELCHGCYACSELCPSDSLPMRPRVMGSLRHSRSGNLDVIEGQLVIGAEQAVPLIRQTLDYADAHFRPETLRILDSPPGTSCPVLEVGRDADLVILVTEPTPFGLHDLKLAVDAMRRLGTKFSVVLNRYGIGDARVEDYCAAEDIALIARIPNSRQIAATCAAGRLLLDEFPEVNRALERIAMSIGSRTGAAVP